MVTLKSVQGGAPFLRSMVVISYFEKPKSFYSHGRQITHQNTELSDAPNITLVSLLINQHQWFENKIFY